jgi:hypothetical protein
VSFIIERRIRNESLGRQLAPSEAAGYVLRNPEGGFEEVGFQTKMNAIKGYIFTDIASFPSVDVFVVPVDLVRRWHSRGELGSNARVSRITFLTHWLDSYQ